MKALDPVETRISEHFLLSDFMGNHSVYSRGLANVFTDDQHAHAKLANARALAEQALEPILEAYGPISVSYGYISPALSRELVKYQDPDIPSHHRWDLGAAADIIEHIADGLDDRLLSAPIWRAHRYDSTDEIPYSRIITYSESPFVCVAVSAAEVEAGKPRGAFYENRYMGTPKVKPWYRQLSSVGARRKAFKDLVDDGLEHDWRGAGYPTHHGGGRQQYQHMRVSRYTMVSDWLFDLSSITKGAKNVPSLNDDEVQDAFAAAGILYDALVNQTETKRFSIIAGYVSHINPYFDPAKDWRDGRVQFTIMPPASVDPDELMAQTEFDPGGFQYRINADRSIEIDAEIEYVLTQETL